VRSGVRESAALWTAKGSEFQLTAEWRRSAETPLRLNRNYACLHLCLVSPCFPGMPWHRFAHRIAKYVLLFVWLLLGLTGFASTNEHVILITIDGLANFYLADPKAQLPTLHNMAAEGAQAAAMHVANPAGTWPNHTTLITGVYSDMHSVLFNGVLVRDGPGRPVHIEGDRDQWDLFSIPAVYDRLHAAGYRTAAINWPCTRGATNLDDNFPDTPDRIRYTTPRLRAELIRDSILENRQEASFLKKGAPARDRAWCAAAVHLLKVRPPNLLLLHLLATDVVQHRSGPQTPEAYAALATADAQVAEIFHALDVTGLRSQTTVIVASDHGFARPSTLINPNVVLRKAGLLRPGPRRRAQSVSEGGIAFVYLTDPATASVDRVTVKALLRGIEGIESIIEPSDYSALHLPMPSYNPLIGDLLLVAKPSYTFSDEYFEDEVLEPIPMALGSHGYLASDPRMDGIFIACGKGIKPGTKLGAVQNVDIAPLVMALLGQPLPGAVGRVPVGILSK
jgi:predicted AlkP superfamily pyrophosphatase or phosphodiesterase